MKNLKTNLNMKNYLIILLLATSIFGCADDDTNTATEETTATEEHTTTLNAMANITAKSASNVTGTVTFTETDGRVTMEANITGLTPGKHAIHIHESGDCSAEDGSSAGGHWNPTNVNHGKWGEAPFHIGDIGNLEANADGNGTISRDTDLWCIGCDDTTKNIVGKSIIIHEGIDDFSSQPAGAAGARIGCGEIVSK